MTVYKTMKLEEGESIQLQSELKPSEVRAVNSNTIAVVHRGDAPQSTYRRQFERDTSPTHTNISLPDTAVVMGLPTNGSVHYLVEE